MDGFGGVAGGSPAEGVATLREPDDGKRSERRMGERKRRAGGDFPLPKIKKTRWGYVWKTTQSYGIRTDFPKSLVDLLCKRVSNYVRIILF